MDGPTTSPSRSPNIHIPKRHEHDANPRLKLEQKAMENSNVEAWKPEDDNKLNKIYERADQPPVVEELSTEDRNSIQSTSILLSETPASATELTTMSDGDSTTAVDIVETHDLSLQIGCQESLHPLSGKEHDQTDDLLLVDVSVDTAQFVQKIDDSPIYIDSEAISQLQNDLIYETNEEHQAVISPESSAEKENTLKEFTNEADYVITKELIKQLAKAKVLFEINIEVNGTPYYFSIRDNDVSLEAFDHANAFCEKYQKYYDFKSFAHCVSLLKPALENAIIQGPKTIPKPNTQSDAYDLVISVNGDQFTITMSELKQSYPTAEKFCKMNAVRYRLNDENNMRECVLAVNATLTDEFLKALEKRARQTGTAEANSFGKTSAEEAILADNEEATAITKTTGDIGTKKEVDVNIPIHDLVVSAEAVTQEDGTNEVSNDAKLSLNDDSLLLEYNLANEGLNKAQIEQIVDTYEVNDVPDNDRVNTHSSENADGKHSSAEPATTIYQNESSIKENDINVPNNITGGTNEDAQDIEESAVNITNHEIVVESFTTDVHQCDNHVELSSSVEAIPHQHKIDEDIDAQLGESTEENDTEAPSENLPSLHNSFIGGDDVPVIHDATIQEMASLEFDEGALHSHSTASDSMNNELGQDYEEEYVVTQLVIGEDNLSYKFPIYSNSKDVATNYCLKEWETLEPIFQRNKLSVVNRNNCWEFISDLTSNKIEALLIEKESITKSEDKLLSA